jgi:hypothetical protein
MRRLLNPTVALTTFIIGTSAVFLWLASQRISLPKPEAQPASFSAAVTPPRSDLEAERYAVYSAVIKDMYAEGGVKLLVISRDTGCWTPSDEEKVGEERRSVEDYAVKKLPGLKLETVDDFNAEMKECVSLTKRLDIPLKYVFVTDEELKPIFPKDGKGTWWPGFYAKFPGSSGLISFSNVGFDRDVTQALVSTARGCGGLCGAGYYVLLEKEGGVWKVRSKTMTWVS